MSAHSHTHTNRKPSQEQTAEVVSQEDEAECSPDSGYTSVCAVLWDSFDVLFVLHTRIVLHTHPHTVPHPTRLNHLHILIVSIYLSPSTHKHLWSCIWPHSSFFLFFKKKNTLPWLGLWNRGYAPGASGSNEEKSSMLNWFQRWDE